MAVTSVTGIALFTDRLERALLLESANMLAADRIVSGRGELPEAVLAEGRSGPAHRPNSLFHLNGFFGLGQPAGRSKSGNGCLSAARR